MEIDHKVDAQINAVNQNVGHQGIPLYKERTIAENTNSYRKIYQEIAPYSKRLQRYITDALKDIKEGSLAKHKPYGRVFRAQDTYRPDGLCYAKKKLPQDLPDMAVSVLVDNSGSMSGRRIQNAIKAATLLYDFATGLNIPVAVSGHSTCGAAVQYTTYANFERANDKDKYRICSMTTQGSNRDGMAIEIAANLLSQRPEDVKLLIIISDGQPNHYGYGGKEAAKDIQAIIRKYKRKGVEIIAAAIGDDRENIRPIYGDAFLDVAELESLPKRLTALIKKRIIRDAI